jgi:hypothetical protein
VLGPLVAKVNIQPAISSHAAIVSARDPGAFQDAHDPL